MLFTHETEQQPSKGTLHYKVKTPQWYRQFNTVVCLNWLPFGASLKKVSSRKSLYESKEKHKEKTSLINLLSHCFLKLLKYF